MKRVNCLYRVSSKKQVDKDGKNQAGIPMQKNACHEFVGRQHDWEKEAAFKGEFEVLLVFMFDRIGRIDDETPFIVEWFVKHGIEVWSTQEGRQMALDGLYTGWTVKFGYRLVDSGLVNRKGIPIKKYEIDPEESEIVHLIDDMTIHKGYGCHIALQTKGQAYKSGQHRVFRRPDKIFLLPQEPKAVQVRRSDDLPRE